MGYANLFETSEDTWGEAGREGLESREAAEKLF